MTSALFAPVCSITRTRRRRFLWAAWWTGPPTRSPFQKPDASEGGARTRDEALAAAQLRAGCAVLEIEGSWARAWANVLVGKAPFATTSRPASTGSEAAARAPRSTKNQPSIWQTLGLKSDATPLEIKRAYRQRALETHPDRGGNDAAFHAVQSAYELALARAARPRRRTE